MDTAHSVNDPFRTTVKQDEIEKLKQENAKMKEEYERKIKVLTYENKIKLLQQEKKVE